MVASYQTGSASGVAAGGLAIVAVLSYRAIAFWPPIAPGRIPADVEPAGRSLMTWVDSRGIVD